MASSDPAARWEEFQAAVAAWLTDSAEVEDVARCLTVGSRVDAARLVEFARAELVGRVNSCRRNRELGGIGLAERLAEGGVLPMFGMPSRVRVLFHELVPLVLFKLRTVEHLIGTFPFHVVRQDDGQKSVLSRLVVQGLDRLDLQGGMQPELVKLEFRPRSVRIVGPLLHAGQPVPFLAGRSFAFFFLGSAGCRVLHWDAHG